MSARKIETTLTRAQFEALAAAVATQDLELESYAEARSDAMRRTLDRAWKKIHGAYHAPRRGARS